MKAQKITKGFAGRKEKAYEKGRAKKALRLISKKVVEFAKKGEFDSIEGFNPSVFKSSTDSL